MVWLQNLIIIIIGFLLSRILIEEKLHVYFINSIFRKKEIDISYLTTKILFLSYALSLFFPNTIVVITLIPIIKIIIDKVKANSLVDMTGNNKLSTNLVLALIYGSNIGGMGSMIGASSNIYFLGYIELQKIPGRENISFFPWLILGIPLTFILLLIGKFVLNIGAEKDIYSSKLTLLPSKKPAQIINNFFIFLLLNISFIIILSAIQFIKKPSIIFMNFNIIDIIFISYLFIFIFLVLIFPKGKFKWKRMFKNISELFLNIILFPLIYISELLNEIQERFNLSKRNQSERILKKLFNKLWFFQFKEKKRNLKKQNTFAYISINRIFYDLPFLGLTFMGIVILFLYLILKIGDNPHSPEFDGYIYLFIKDTMQSLITADTNFTALLIIIIFVSIFFTEIISNTTIIIIMFSLITTIAPTININPLFLMLAVTISSTATFMSPIASPVNAIAYASIKGVSLKQMFYKGLLLNILSIIWITIVFYFFNI